MRNIAKGSEPKSLEQHRSTPHSNYENYKQKDELRDCLLAEQGCLCCYCTQRIPQTGHVPEMKIEHWHSQTGYPLERLTYQNLLAACPGDSGPPDSKMHCDSLKGDSDLALNPANPLHNVESRVRYLHDGTVRSDHPEFDVQLDKVLNLNHAILRRNRKAVADSVVAEVSMKPGSRTKGEIEGLIRNWSTPVDGSLKEHCWVAIYYLRKKLNRIP